MEKKKVLGYIVFHLCSFVQNGLWMDIYSHKLSDFGLFIILSIIIVEHDDHFSEVFSATLSPPGRFIRARQFHSRFFSKSVTRYSNVKRNETKGMK